MGWGGAKGGRAVDEPCFSLIATSPDFDFVGNNDERLRLDLEKGDLATKMRTLQILIRLCILEPTRFASGSGRSTLMAVIRFLLPVRDHAIKRLLLVFWEVVPKTDPNGELLQEMILVCDAFRRDLEHANEFIRGGTLRLVAKLSRHAELLEPLVPCIRACLSHRHAYVRRNAALCMHSIVRKRPDMLPDAPKMLESFLDTEADPSAKRNAFLALCEIDPQRALCFVEETDWSNSDALERSGCILLQSHVVQLIYQMALRYPEDSWRHVQSVFHLLRSNSPSVRFEAARVLCVLSPTSAAIRAAGQTLVELAVATSDNNAKLVLLDAVDQLRHQHPLPLEALAVEVVRVLPSANDAEVHRRALRLIVALTTSRTADDLVTLLQRELRRLQSSLHQQGDAVAATEAVLNALENCVARFPHTAGGVIECLTQIVSSENKKVSSSVLRFLRETLVRFPEFAPRATGLVLEHFAMLRGTSAIRQGCWLLGEFCENPKQIQEFIEQVTRSMGELPLVESEERRRSGDVSKCNGELDDGDSSHDGRRGQASTNLSRHSEVGPLERRPPAVTADGAYASQSAFSVAKPDGSLTSAMSVGTGALRSYLLQGYFFVAACVCNAVAKAACRLITAYSEAASEGRDTEMTGENKVNVYAVTASALRILASCLALAESGLAEKPATIDDRQRMSLSFRLLLEAQRPDRVPSLSVNASRRALESFIASADRRRRWNARNERWTVKTLPSSSNGGNGDDDDVQERDLHKDAVDAPIAFSLLAGGGSRLQRLSGVARTDQKDIFAESLRKALSGDLTAKREDDLIANSLLGKVTQLTGRNDPVYAECYVNVAAHMVELDVFVLNQTDDVLQNCTLELSTIGRLPTKRDLKLIDRINPVVIAPHDFVTLRVTIKVTATDNGLIFGNISYDVKGCTADTHVVVLNDIRINIVDFLVAEERSEDDFRQLWAGLEWENKVSVSTPVRDLGAFLDLLVRHTNMACLTHCDGWRQSSNFLAANLSARSLFGEDALANVCLEQEPPPGNQLIGHIRVRARSQGLALCLGDTIKEVQKCAAGY